MTKKKGMGKDPFADRLNWIKDTTTETQASRQTDPSASKEKKMQDEQTGRPISAKVGLKSGWTRATVIVREERLEAIKALAYWRREQLKDVVDRALALYLKTEKKVIDDALAAYHGAKER